MFGETLAATIEVAGVELARIGITYTGTILLEINGKALSLASPI